MRFNITLAKPEDSQSICRLFRIPFAGEISLAIEREPDYFLGAKVQYEEPEIYVCRDKSNNRIAACFNVGKRNVFLNGSKTLLRYHSDLRIDPDYQKTSALFDICSHFRKHIVLLEGFSQTIVFSDNQIMNILINLKNHRRLRATIPFYITHGQYVTHTIAIKEKKAIDKFSYAIRQARKDDLSMMQEFFDQEACRKQFYPCYDFSKIGSDYFYGLTPENYFLAFDNDQIVGITGFWNQQDLKQTRVVKYSNRLRFLRPVINLLAPFYDGFLLPDEGTKLNSVMLHSIVVRNNDQKIFRQLCGAIYEYSWKNDFDYMLCGLDESDNLNEVFKGYTRRQIKGTHYLVSYDENCLQKINKGLFYLEAARI